MARLIQVVGLFVFFFKQKTAYEMRISDWSSDVCSSDLVMRSSISARSARRRASSASSSSTSARRRLRSIRTRSPVSSSASPPPTAASGAALRIDGERSEEHTSELQSLMRISYAVFCLKKKNKQNAQRYRTHETLDENIE